MRIIIEGLLCDSITYRRNAYFILSSLISSTVSGCIEQ